MAKSKTLAERNHIQRVAELGCCICQMPAEIHHITTGVGMGQRASNYDVIPLCPDHHRHGQNGKLAIHQGKQTWENTHGTELHFLELVKEALN